MKMTINTHLGEAQIDMTAQELTEFLAAGATPVTTTPPATTEEVTPVCFEPKPRPSRLDAMFGPREDWGRGGSGATGHPGHDHAPGDHGGPEPYYLHQDDEVGDAWPTDPAPRKYKGFLSIKCEYCGKIHDFCAKYPMSFYKCDHCGHETKLEGLHPAHAKCQRDGREAHYLTNQDGPRITIACVECQHPMRLQLNERGTTYLPAKEADET